MAPRHMSSESVQESASRTRSWTERLDRRVESVPSTIPMNVPPLHPTALRAHQEVVRRWQSIHGNHSLQRSVLSPTVPATVQRDASAPIRRAPQLRTSTDSHVTTEKTGLDAYTIHLHLTEGGVEHSWPI